MSEPEFSVFEYLYRDAGNYKAWGEVLLKGTLSQVEIEQMQDRFSAQENFIAEPVGIPAVGDAGDLLRNVLKVGDWDESLSCNRPRT